MAQRFVPVVASIAVDEFGQAYNVNADVVAAELAIALDAEKLVFLNDVPGLIGPTGDLLSELSAEQCLDLLGQEGVVEGGMIPKLESAAERDQGRRGTRAPGGRPGRAFAGPGAVHARGRRHHDHARRRGADGEGGVEMSRGQRRL